MKTPETPSGSLRSPAPPTGEPDPAVRNAGPLPEGAPGEAGGGSQHSPEGASPWAEEDAALKAALPHLKLPPKRQGPIKTPKKREGPILPDLEGKRFRCPYCGKVSAWPPPELKCPECGKTLRPPPGFGPKDREKRRVAKEKIADARDKALREMGRRAGAREPGARTGVLLVALFMLAVGIAVISASTRSAERARGGLDKRAWTTNAMDTLCMAVEHFKADVGRYPTHQEGGLLALVNDVGAPDWCGPYIKKLMTDGWSRPFFYDQSNGVPVLLSAGEDGTFLTEDDLSVRPEQFRMHPDFVPHDESRLLNPHKSSVGILRRPPAAQAAPPAPAPETPAP